MGFLGMQQMESGQCFPRKTERKIIEKNRRNQMKTLYSKLNSLLPNQNSKETLSLPDQIDEAVNYIKSLETTLKKSEEKKEKLRGRKRLHECTNSTESTSSSKSPKIEIREMGTSLEVALISGLDNQFIFYEVIRILHEEGIEVVNATFSVVGNSVFHSVHAQMRETALGFGTTRITERLNSFINGSTSEVEYQPQLWDFEINPEKWDF